MDATQSAIRPLRRTRAQRRARRSRRTIVLLGGIVAAFAVWRSIAHAQLTHAAPMPLPYAFLPSPNCDNRPAGSTIDCVVVHSTVEPTMEGTIAIFLTPSRRVSAHFVVGKDGRVVQMVPVEKRAWHAGRSVLNGVSTVNNFSVGIEMVNLNDGKDPYTEPQIEAVAGIVRFLRSRYTIPDERIVSHAQIALPAGRKSDPAAFDFAKLRALASVPIDPAGGAPPATGPNSPPETDRSETQ